MSGLASGVTKIFSSIGTGVAKLGSAVKGVGASLFTGGAASGSSIFSGGLSKLFGGGTLGKMFSGASSVVGGSGSATALGGAAADTLGSAVTKGFGMGAGGSIGAGASSALGVANTATGLAPTGVSGASSAFKGFGDFLNSDLGAGLIGGVGEGLMRQGELDAQAEEAQAGRDYSQKQVDDLRNSYELPADALPGGRPMAPDKTVRPTPAVAYDRKRTRIIYDPKVGQIVEA